MPDEPKDTQALLNNILKAMNAGFAEMREGFAEIAKELKIMSRQIGNLEKQMARITAEHEEFDDRVTKLENPSGIQ